MTLYEEIGTALKMKRKGDESFEDFAVRFAKKANSLPEPEWGELTEELQFFCNGVLQAREAKQEVKTEISYTDSAGEVHEVEFTGWPGDEAEADEAEEAPGEAAGEETADEANEEPGGEGEPDGEESVDSGDDSEQEAVSEEEEQPAPRKKAGKPKPAKKAAKAPAKKAELAAPPPKTVKTTKPTGKAKAMATPKTAKKETSGERAARINDDHKIKLVTKENPHRSGTKLFNMFKKYKDGMTVAQAKKAGLPVSNIAYLKGLGHLKVSAA